jgi:ABC-2 type transport system ATP-binding protein
VAANVIELSDLTKNYGSHAAVDHLNLTIRKGEVFGLLGPNGAGKSTTILMMIGLTDPTSGSVKVCGIDSTVNPMEVKTKVGYLPEDIGFYDDLTGLENLMYTARLNRISNKEAAQKAAQLLREVGLSGAATKIAGKYSRGKRQRLGLADVLIKNPEVIILDEPTLGIDPTGVREFLELIVGLSREESITVLFSSHNLHQVQQVCDRIGLFISGKLLAAGNIQNLSKDLFTDSPYIIEVGFSQTAPGGSGFPGNKHPEDRLKEVLQNIEGIMAVNVKNDIFHVECSRDLTSDIARAVVESGAALNYLNKKEYGLDDIYYRYFEGGENHE